VSIEELAEIDGVSGRDIKTAVVMAAIGAARRDLGLVTRSALISALEAQRNSRPAPTEASTETDQVDKEVVAEHIQQHLNAQQRVEVPHGPGQGIQ
jgi:hypothetical protein